MHTCLFVVVFLLISIAFFLCVLPVSYATKEVHRRQWVIESLGSRAQYSYVVSPAAVWWQLSIIITVVVVDVPPGANFTFAAL